jgi:small subunit ribosomal protein S17
MANIESIVKTKVGTVVSNRMNKSLVVEIVRVVQDPKYKKRTKFRTKLHVHDENNVAQIGDTVKIKETRPISKLKSWTLVEVISQ